MVSFASASRGWPDFPWAAPPPHPAANEANKTDRTNVPKIRMTYLFSSLPIRAKKDPVPVQCSIAPDAGLAMEAVPPLGTARLIFSFRPLTSSSHV